MNHIKIQKVMTQYGYEEEYWHIDGKGLPEYLDECITASRLMTMHKYDILM